MKHRIRVAITDLNKLTEIRAHCDRLGLELFSDQEIKGSYWLKGHVLKLGEVLATHWPTADGLSELMEQVPSNWRPEMLQPVHVASVVAHEAALMVEAFSMADVVHRYLLETGDTRVTHLELVCTGSYWAASFDPETIGSDVPWFEMDQVAKFPLAFYAETIHGAICGAAQAVLKFVYGDRFQGVSS